MPVSNYHHLLLNKAEERSSHLLRSGSLKSRTLHCGRWLLMSEETCCRGHNNDFPVLSPQTSQTQKICYGEQYPMVMQEFGAMAETLLQWENRRDSPAVATAAVRLRQPPRLRDEKFGLQPSTDDPFSRSHVIYVNVFLFREKRWTGHCKFYIYIFIYLFTAIELLPGGSGYFTCKQNVKSVTTNLSREGYMRSM
jgi:hypothetical protein